MGLKTKLIALCLLSTTVNATENNDAIKTCLLANGYEGNTQIMGFDFTKAAACYHDWKSGKLREEYINAQLWLEEHPWYKGKNWNWEEMAVQHPGRTTIRRYQ